MLRASRRTMGADERKASRDRTSSSMIPCMVKQVPPGREPSQTPRGDPGPRDKKINEISEPCGTGPTDGDADRGGAEAGRHPLRWS